MFQLSFFLLLNNMSALWTYYNLSFHLLVDIKIFFQEFVTQMKLLGNILTCLCENMGFHFSYGHTEKRIDYIKWKIYALHFR